MPVRNWAQSYTYRARSIRRPASLDQLRDLVAHAPRLRVVGTRHSFNGIGDADTLVDLSRLPKNIVINRSESTVSLAGGVTYADLFEHLDDHHFALPNVASLPHVTVAGAVQTATHGSGDKHGNLATSVVAIDVLGSDGDVRTYRRGDAEFDGVVVGLGALGCVTRLTLALIPTFDVVQHVFVDLTWDALGEHFAEIISAGYGVSLFTTWGETAGDAWVKEEADSATLGGAADFFGAKPATTDLHPVPGGDAAQCTPQMGRRGPWYDRLPHFRLGAFPSIGDETQSEYIVPRHVARDAIDALREIAAEIRPVLHVAEIRAVARDTLWMSPQHGQDTVGFHFTWHRESAAVHAAIIVVEGALAPFDPRPHWGKLFFTETATRRYPRRQQFLKLAEQLDPRGAFRNEWFERYVADGG